MAERSPSRSRSKSPGSGKAPASLLQADAKQDSKGKAPAAAASSAATLGVPGAGAAKPARPRQKVPVGYSPLRWFAEKEKQPVVIPRKMTKEELKQHKSPEDAWTAINGRIYNVTPYLKFHPGGEPKLLAWCGRDGTKGFNNHHPYINVESMLDRLLVGYLIEEDESGKAKPRFLAP